MKVLEVKVENVYSVLSDYTAALEESLTVTYQNYWFSSRYRSGLWDGKHHFLKFPSLKFPTGLLFLVKEYCICNDITLTIYDNRQVPDTEIPLITDASILQGITLRSYQIEATNQALKEKRGVIELPTASGKTEVAASIIKQLGLRTLFLVHTKDLLHQTIERFEKRLQRSVGCVGDGILDVNDKSIIVATVQSVSSLLNKRETETKRFLNSFQLFFQDEVHHSSAQEWTRIGNLMTNAYYRFGLSGTILRRDELSNMKMLALFGSPIYRKKASELAALGFLAPIEIRIVDNPEIIMADDYQQMYAKGIVQSVCRNTLIANLAEKQYKESKKVLVLVRHIEHGEILAHTITHDYDVPALFLSGKDDSEIRNESKKRFDSVDGLILISSPIWDEGVDVPQINVLINASGGKSEWKTIQKIGRGLRIKSDGSKLIVYDFADRGKFLQKHSKERAAIYEREGFEVIWESKKGETL